MVLSSLGESVPAVPVTYFLHNILPPLRQDLNLDVVIDRLKQGQERNDKTCPALKDDRWTCFHTDPEVDPRLWETTIYRALEDVAEAIHQASGLPEDDCTVIFKCNPNGSLLEHSTYTSKPDGFAIERGANVHNVQWRQIAIPGEFRKDEFGADDVGAFFLRIC